MRIIRATPHPSVLSAGRGSIAAQKGRLLPLPDECWRDHETSSITKAATDQADGWSIACWPTEPQQRAAAKRAAPQQQRRCGGIVNHHIETAMSIRSPHHGSVVWTGWIYHDPCSRLTPRSIARFLLGQTGLPTHGLGLYDLLDGTVSRPPRIAAAWVSAREVWEQNMTAIDWLGALAEDV